MENCVRPIALGKKNWLFAGSERAGQRAAAIQTLLGTAKLNDLNPEECKRLFFPRRQAKQLDLEAQLFLSNSRAEIDPMPRVRSACQVWESQ